MNFHHETQRSPRLETVVLLTASAILACAAISSGSSHQSARYAVLSLSPASFPVNPLIPWPPVRDMSQAGMTVACPAGTPAPRYVRFRDRNGLDLEVQVSGAVQIPGGWRLTTPHALTPNVLHGIVGVSAGTHGVAESTMVTGMMP